MRPFRPDFDPTSNPVTKTQRMSDEYDRHFDRHWFRDLLRQRDRTIANLRREIDEANDLISRLRKRTGDALPERIERIETGGADRPTDAG